MMNDTTNNGGPAFPSGIVRKSRPAHDPGADFHVTDFTEPRNAGMTLRDYFAAKAMPLAFDYVRRINTDGYDEDSVDGRSNSFNSTYDFTWHDESGSEQGDVYMVAEYAYQMADAMLKARGQA